MRLQSKKRISVRAKIFFLSGTLVFLLVGSLGFISFEVQRGSGFIEEQRSSVALSMAVDKVRTEFLIVQYWFNEFALSWQIESQDRAAKELKDFEQAVAELAKLDRTFAETLKKDGENFAQLMTKTAETFVDGNRILGTVLNAKARETANKITNALDERLSNSNGKSFDLLSTTDRVVSHSQYLDKVSIVLMGIGFVISVVIAAFISGHLTRLLSQVTEQIAVSGDQVEIASSKMHSASMELSESASRAASFLQETATSIEQLTSMVNKNAEHSNQASTLSSDSFKSATEGQKEIQKLIASMKEISESSNKIEEIINVMDDISFQTNLLALNAAVEAARAGEQGKGFAVVADAVRALAQRSSAAAEDITKLIKANVSKIEQGTLAADKGSLVLQSIVSSVEKISDLNGDIASASREQSDGIIQISRTVKEMDTLTQANAKSATSVADSSSDLTSEAKSLQTLVDEMRCIIEGSSQRIGHGQEHGSLNMEHVNLTPEAGSDASSEVSSDVRQAA